MNGKWIVLVLALVSLASCSVEKRVYQPGYHIEWNHFAERDVAQDVSQGHSEDATQDASQDLSENLSENLSKNLSKNLSENPDLSENLETDAMQDVSQGRSEGALQNSSQDLSENLSENLETGVSQDLSKNVDSDFTLDDGQSIDSDLEMVLFIILALFLPALTIFLLEGLSSNFWISLLLMILAFSLPLPIFLRGMIQLIAVILAIGVVLHYL